MIWIIEKNGKDRNYFRSKTVKELSSMLERYDVKERWVYLNVPWWVYLNVPYKDKELVKLLGAKYGGDEKKWYIPQGGKPELFSRWEQLEDL